MSRLSVHIGKMEWKNPVTVASGTFGFEYCELMNLSQLGAITTKTITLEPKKGNEPPRIAETEAGMLNSIGIENPGLTGFVNDYLPEYSKFDTNLIVSISGSSEEEFVKLVSELKLHDEIDAFEINVSCPNVENEGIAFGTDCVIVSDLINKIREETDKTLITKLTPNVIKIEEIAKSAEQAGADAISLINTVYGMAIDIETKKTKIKNKIAGYSGVGVKPIALQNVYRVAQSVKIPVIGMGGISNYQDALEFLIAGATAVSIGTYNFVDPTITRKIIRNLDFYLEKNNHKSIQEIINSIQD